MFVAFATTHHLPARHMCRSKSCRCC